jgi:hypothetical protein
MPALKKVKHILTIGSEKYSFRAPDIYGDFNSATGVTKAANPDNTNYTGALTSDDFKTGKACRIKVRAVKTDSNGAITASREFTVVSAFEKAKNALANLDSKKITVGSDTWDIQTTRIPQRRRFS